MKLTESQIKLLEEGNRYTFANIFCEKYPKVAKENDLKPINYASWIDFHEEDKTFTVWNKNGDKDFFNTKMEFLGRKEY